jgi:predicted HTH transcriptional regulator
MNLTTKNPDPKIEQSALKTVAAFLNSAGGTLLVGVDDAGAPLGLAADNFPSEDRMTLHLVNLIKDRLGAEHAPLIAARFVDFRQQRVLLVECKRSSRPVFMKAEREDVFFIRLLAATTELTARKAQTYIRDHFSD